MAGFAMMYFQDPSVTEFQKRWEKSFQTSNLQSIFGLNRTPEDTQLRQIIDDVDSDQLKACFLSFFRRLQRGKYLESFSFLYDSYLVAIDASGYFSSKKVSCPGCLKRKKSDDKFHYQHQILQSVLLHPDKKQVIPFMPEGIDNKDIEKDAPQDCEIEAAKRWMKSFRKIHPKLKVILSGDGLYSKESLIEVAKQNKFSYIFVAKPNDHKYLFNAYTSIRYTKECHHKEVIDEKGNSHSYRWVNGIALTKAGEADVNFIEYELFNTSKGKVTYKNTWVTDLAIAPDNIVKLVKGGRSRWKIENETFNTLKNQGYHITHNYGHGKKNLSMNFFILNLLAFYMHQIFEMTDKLYQEIRSNFSARKEFWSFLRAVFKMMQFESWEAMLIRSRGQPP